MPNISVPKEAKVNEGIEIACSGEVGRDIDGNVETDMNIEVKFEVNYLKCILILHREGLTFFHSNYTFLLKVLIFQSRKTFSLKF